MCSFEQSQSILEWPSLIYQKGEQIRNVTLFKTNECMAKGADHSHRRRTDRVRISKNLGKSIIFFGNHFDNLERIAK